MIANTPKPPYYVVIFTSLRTPGDNDYAEMSKRMIEMVSEQEGYLGCESAREELGITVSYWKDLDSIQKWKFNSEHSVAKVMGKEKWYRSFKTRIAKVERDYGFEK